MFIINSLSLHNSTVGIIKADIDKDKNSQAIAEKVKRVYS